MNLNLEDQDAASQYVSTQIAGKTVQAIELCEGDEEHPAHVDITFSNGVVLYIVEDEDAGIILGMTGVGHKGVLQ